MGVLNVTPDSFSDGGRYHNRRSAVRQGIALAEQGADIIDIGGESSRPGAPPVDPAEELRRVVPVIEELASAVEVPLSVDTTKAVVARRALEAGAQLVNDISALRFDPEMSGVVAEHGVPVVLMHMQGTPQTMQRHIRYDSLLDDIVRFLHERIEHAAAGGIARHNIIIDPGIGFGKSVEKDNFIILRHLGSFLALGRPLLVGPSRKAFIGRVLGTEVDEREEGTLAAVAVAVYNGAHFVRVHNVTAARRAVRIAEAIKRAGEPTAAPPER